MGNDPIVKLLFSVAEPVHQNFSVFPPGRIARFRFIVRSVIRTALIAPTFMMSDNVRDHCFNGAV